MSEIRSDFGIGEDTDYIVLADACKQHELKAVPEMIAAALESEAFVLPLPESGGICGRVVVGDLTDEESSNWVAKAQRQIHLREGKVVIDAGDFFGREAPNESGNHFIVKLESGQYQLTCLIYITDDIATDLFKRHKFSYFKLFRKTHPDRKFPEWLIEEAECRDNDIDEEWFDSISDDEIDDESDDVFIGVVFHFQKDIVVENPTSVSKTGKLKWEKRPLKKFPEPLRLLDAASNAKQGKSLKAIASKFAKAFVNGDFASVVADCSKHLEPEIEVFLTKMHRQVTDKMEVPRRRYLDGLVSYDGGDWIARSKMPDTLADVASLQKDPFGGSFALRLEAEPKRNEVFRVEIDLAFVKPSQGLRVAAIKIRWKVPQRKRRRRLITNGPPCPECGEKLASDMAKQCIHCGANWH